MQKTMRKPRKEKKRGNALFFFNLSTRLRWVVNAMPRMLYPWKMISTAQEAGLAPGPVWTGAEILASTRTRTPDRAARGK